jgi:hypothetical protein
MTESVWLEKEAHLWDLNHRHFQGKIIKDDGIRLIVQERFLGLTSFNWCDLERVQEVK